MRLASTWWKHIVANTLCALVVAALVWGPELLHYRMAEPEYITRESEPMLLVPSNDQLLQLARIDLMEVVSRNANDKAIVTALMDNVLLPGVASRAMTSLSDWPTDLSREHEIDGLILSSLELEDRALRAYEATASASAKSWAFQRIESFMRYEAGLRRPVSYIWNDHAIAARVSVLIRYWRHLRLEAHPDDPRIPRLIASIERHGYLLAKPSHFTVQTNHGVMQNIALIQIAAAFPLLPRAEEWRDLGFRRFEQQMGFYLTPEGVILEHSPGYQHFGVLLLQHMQLLYGITERQVLPTVEAAIRSARHHLKWLQRLDCSLPRIGNTTGGSYPMVNLEDPGCEPPVITGEPLGYEFNARLLPDAGYAIWRGDTAGSWHLTTAWAYHLDHPHKHADEPSLIYWVDGTELVTASGYWPYGHPLYDAANGWRGSNAPHYVGERFGSRRASSLVSHGVADGLGLVEVLTTRADGSKQMRQVVRLREGDLLVLDAMNGATEAVETLWTFDANLAIQPQDAGAYRVVRQDGQLAMTVHPGVLIGEEVGSSTLSGSDAPFAGWTVIDGNPRAASSLVRVMSGSDHVSATYFSLSKAGRIDLSRSSYVSPTQWFLVLEDAGGQRTIERSGSRLLESRGGLTAQLQLTSYVDTPQASAERRSAILEAMQMYPRWRDLSTYRVRLLWLIAALWIFSIGVVGMAARVDRERVTARYLFPAAIFSWAGVAVWIEFFYFP